MPRVRRKTDGVLGSASNFNTHGLGEMIVGFEGPDGDQDSQYIRDYEVQLPDGTWKDMSQAFRDHDLITDNYNTIFFFPKNEEDRARGYAL